METIGTDSMNNVYYYFNDYRLYRESPSKGKKKGDWELVCSNLDEWEEFCEDLKKSRNSYDKKLYKVVGQEIFPTISAKIQVFHFITFYFFFLKMVIYNISLFIFYFPIFFSISLVKKKSRETTTNV